MGHDLDLLGLRDVISPALPEVLGWIKGLTSKGRDGEGKQVTGRRGREGVE